eukprot:SAG11_NODE_691_length_7699_cov_3.868026_6_plen_129_part_00
MIVPAVVERKLTALGEDHINFEDRKTLIELATTGIPWLVSNSPKFPYAEREHLVCGMGGGIAVAVTLAHVPGIYDPRSQERRRAAGKALAEAERHAFCDEWCRRCDIVPQVGGCCATCKDAHAAPAGL